MANLLALTGAALLVFAILAQKPPPPTPIAGSSGPVRAAPPMRSSRPISLTIPAIGLRVSIQRLGLDSKRELQAPPDPEKAGWYDASAAPGVLGVAVLAGHVTWDQEPGAFFRLGELRPGDRVRVRRADGRTAIFSITKIAQYSKDQFPTAQVYGQANQADLRLITCGGRYDSGEDRYLANVVAFGTLVAKDR